jgi:hypothetical protein
MNSIFSVNWFLAVAIWYTVNGILHDIFVIKKHVGGYDRELLRLLMDGHVLILSGALLFVSWMMVRQGIALGAIAALIIGLGMIVYCAMIFPFLKSIVTLLLSIIICIVSTAIWFRLRS